MRKTGQKSQKACGETPQETVRHISIYDIETPDPTYPIWAKHLLGALREHNLITYQHSINVSLLMLIYAREKGFDDAECELYYTTGLFHDIGKLAIKSSILNEAGILGREEKDIVGLHPYYGAKLMEGLGPRVTQAILHHHDDFGDIVEHDELIDALHCLDVYDAVRQVRPYSASVDRSVAYDYLSKHSGIRFSGEAVQTLIGRMDKYTYKRYELT